MKFFSYDNIFFRIMTKAADVFIVSLLWILFSLPVVTLGASTSALYYTVRKVILKEKGYVWNSFWTQFKDHFKDSLICTVLMELLFAFLLYDVNFAKAILEKEPDSFFGVLYYFFYLGGFLVILWAMHVFCYRARFEMGWKGSLKNGGILLISTFGWSALILCGIILCIVIVRDMPFFLLVLPALMAVLWYFTMEKTYRRIMSPEDREAQA